MSDLEREMDRQIWAAGFPAAAVEFRFMPRRRYRFDRAWPERRIALECEGGTWVGGRHTTGKGYESDCVKYSEAAIRGWTVIRATKQMVEDGRALDLLTRAFLASTTTTEEHTA